MSEELKPCPFCGGTDIGHSPGSIIACMNNNCGGNVDIGPPWGGPKEDGIAFLIAAWNTRTPPADRSVGEWRPIESAPKDGAKFDAWVPGAFGGHRMTDLSFNNRGKLRQHGLLTEAELPRWPTHWMPLPSPPTETEER